jgi:hypothetical protein
MGVFHLVSISKNLCNIFTKPYNILFQTNAYLQYLYKGGDK